jgi:ribosome-binding protein aMBF1 (putative translation factor)
MYALCPAFAAGYAEERAKIDSVDRVIRMLDEARIELGMSKAELARQISAKPEIVRRLFTVKDPNPTIGTVAKLAAVVGLRLELVPKSSSARTRKSRPRHTAGSGIEATAP